MADAATVDLLRKQRAAFKGQLTKFKSHLTSATTIGGLESLLHRLQAINGKYDGIQSKLETLDDSSFSDRVAFDEEYLGFETILRDKIHDIKRSEDSTITTSFHNTSFNDLSANNSAHVGLRLPEITLPTFNGLELEWLAFRDVFVDLIHSKSLDSAIKFRYLISSIRTGSAYAFVENLPVTSANYDTAWKTLCDQYDNEVSIQRIHTREVYDLKPPLEHSSRALQHFVDKAIKHISALKSLNVNVGEWDLLLVHHLTQRLDNSSRIFVVKNTKPNVALSFKTLVEVLRARISILQALSANSHPSSSRVIRDNKLMSLNVSSSSEIRCLYCSGSHMLPHCPGFSSERMTPRSRFYCVRDRRLCGKCLVERHLVRQCTRPPCDACSLNHHTLLRFKTEDRTISRFNNQSVANQPAVVACNNPDTEVTVTTNELSRSVSMTFTGESLTTSLTHRSVILLGTALIHVSANTGVQVLCRALLDSGSTLNFVTEQTSRLLQARQYPTSKTITGIGATESHIKHKVYLTILSRVTNFSSVLKFYVIPKITNMIPSGQIVMPQGIIPSDITLADPHFNVPDRIDLLLGAEIYHELIRGSSIKLNNELPPLYDSELGYVICGKARRTSTNFKIHQSHISLCSVETLESQMRKFWELETFPIKSIWSQEESESEEHYKANVSRTSEGRYIVGLPTKPNLTQLGSSYYSAYRQFVTLERRLQSKPDIYTQYREFMNEYKSLGHMTLGKSSEVNPVYYLPHHCVIKEQSSTIKLRVVFNESSRTSSNLSLNDCLMVGPTIQPNLLSTILPFRKYPIAFCGDIAKMYRQILVHKDQQPLQRATDDIQIFNLATVTYGTACAPFLATRTLKQLSMDEMTQFPLASPVLARDFHVDDLLTGASNVNDALMLKHDLIGLLNLGGFELRKFVSNSEQLASVDQSQSSVTLVLGLSWNTTSDSFEMHFNKLSLTSTRHLSS